MTSQVFRARLKKHANLPLRTLNQKLRVPVFKKGKDTLREKCEKSLSTPPVGIALLRSRANPKKNWFRLNKCARSRMHLDSVLWFRCKKIALSLRASGSEEYMFIRLFRICHEIHCCSTRRRCPRFCLRTKRGRALYSSSRGNQR